MAKYVVRMALLPALLACMVLPSTTYANWPMFHKDVTHSGITSQDGAEEDHVAWWFPIEKPSG
jgi:hypothetical protein